jgi:hypothetical protein
LRLKRCSADPAVCIHKGTGHYLQWVQRGTWDALSRKELHQLDHRLVYALSASITEVFGQFRGDGQLRMQLLYRRLDRRFRRPSS